MHRPPAISDLVGDLGLQPHPEGGWFAETWRDEPADGSRGAGSSIYYLLTENDASAWHRIDASEVWHHYAGAPVDLSVSFDATTVSTVRLGPNVGSGELPQAHVPAGAWQAARPAGGWALLGCTVAPAFTFEGFELAPAGWEPGETVGAGDGGQEDTGALGHAETPIRAAGAGPVRHAVPQVWSPGADVVLVELVHYHAWADRRVVSSCREAAADRLVAAAPGTYGSILLTLEHMASSQAEFLGYLTADVAEAASALGPTGRPDAAGSGSPAERLERVGDRLAALDARLAECVATLPSDDPTRVRESAGTEPAGTAFTTGSLVLHIITHAVAHRAQVASTLGQVGAFPPSLDFIFFAAEEDPFRDLSEPRA